MGAKQLTTHPKKPKGGVGAVKTRLTTLSDVIGELGSIYRQVKARQMPEDRGKALAWILGQLRSALEAQHLERIEAKLDAATGKQQQLIDRTNADDIAEVADAGNEGQRVH